MDTQTSRMRITEEFDELNDDPDVNDLFGVSYWDSDSDDPDIYHWKVTLMAPQGSLYEGGFFKIEIIFNKDYPESPPKVKFLTKIYHCNIDSYNGKICLNTLNNWDQSFKIGDVLNHIVVLLINQNPDSPLNHGDEYNENKDEFIKTAKEWVKKYANINDFENEEKQGIKPGFNDFEKPSFNRFEEYDEGEDKVPDFNRFEKCDEDEDEILSDV